MPKLGIKCPSCGKVTAIDSARLPDKPVRLACPSCQHKIVIDKTKLLKPKEDASPAASAEPAEKAAAPQAPAPMAPSPEPSPSELSSPAPEQAQKSLADDPFGSADEPAAAQEPSPPEEPAPTKKEAPAEPEQQPEPQLDEPPPREPAASPMPPPSSPPTGASRGSTDEKAGTLPSGIIVGADKQAMHGLKQALIPRGCNLEHIATSELENHLHQGLPPLILMVTDEVSSPPFEPLQPVRQLPPVERRDTFVVLISNNLKTLDGSAAFFYEVNMILNKRDISKVPQALAVALEAHKKLYRPFLIAIEEREKQLI